MFSLQVNSTMLICILGCGPTLMDAYKWKESKLAYSKGEQKKN